MCSIKDGRLFEVVGVWIGAVDAVVKYQDVRCKDGNRAFLVDASSPALYPVLLMRFARWFIYDSTRYMSNMLRYSKVGYTRSLNLMH